MTTIHRAHWIFDTPSAGELRMIEKGALVVDAQGIITAVGPYTVIKKTHPRAKVIDHGSYTMITSGFVDGHVHAPQLEMMAAAGYSLLEWLNNHTFPTEAKYANVSYAEKKYKEFCRALLKCGTTLAAVYATSHTKATAKLLEVAAKSGLRAHIGKVLMDRNAPENLIQPADRALRDLEGLIKKWRNHERVRASLAIRFAPTTTDEMFKGAQEILREHSDLVVQTHLAETQEEVQWVKELYPNSSHYTDVYDKYGILGAKTVLGHCIYLSDEELSVLRERGSHLVHCPSSNFFLGSGLFPYKKYLDRRMSVAMGSDVGAGWDLSLQTTARSCYDAQALQKYFMKPSELLYLITRAGALALGESDLGLLQHGYKADFVVHDLRGRDLALERVKCSESPEELLSALLFLGGELTVSATYIQGKAVYKNSI